MTAIVTSVPAVIAVTVVVASPLGFAVAAVTTVTDELRPARDVHVVG